jgi:hypothetical protein
MFRRIRESANQHLVFLLDNPGFVRDGGLIPEWGSVPGASGVFGGTVLRRFGIPLNYGINRVAEPK